MKSLNHRLYVLLLFALLPGKGVAQPGPLPIESIDLAVLNAQTVVVGKITSFEGEEGWQKQRTVTVVVGQTLKGRATNSIVLETYSSTNYLGPLRDRHASVLVILRPKQRYLNRIIDLDDPKLVASREDFSLLQDGKSLVQYVKDVVRRNPGVDTMKSFCRWAPDDAVGRAWSHAMPDEGYHDGVGAAMHGGLLVPADAKLEAWARGRLKAKGLHDMTEGLLALGLFKSKQNAALMKPLLQSPLYTISGDYDVEPGTEARSYDIRRLAYRFLSEWGVKVEEPVTRVRVDLSETVERIDIFLPVTDERIQKLTQCKNLHMLSLEAAALTDDQLARLGTIRTLDHISLIGAPKITTDGLRRFAAHTKVRTFWIFHAPIGDEGAKALAVSKNLRNVRIEDCGVTDTGRAELARLRPDVRCLKEGVPDN